MGKIDDMRRLREEQFARNARANEGAAKKASTASAPSTASAAIPSASAAAPRASAKAASYEEKASSAAEEGKCPTCGKMKPLTNGLLANHQKGFGKACAGSRKEPA